MQMIATPIQNARPKKATVKFGMELAIESGQLTAVIVKGSGKANLEITLEWERSDKGES
ncbi:CU044_2847 family protein [Nodosilinea nodulosa]|uniref:CU044_2847 family protein n=1 Tax=Nodosilinea nodulosa TaxID=416001 RepID=UPI0021F8D9A6